MASQSNILKFVAKLGIVRLLALASIGRVVYLLLALSCGTFPHDHALPVTLVLLYQRMCRCTSHQAHHPGSALTVLL